MKETGRRAARLKGKEGGRQAAAKNKMKDIAYYNGAITPMAEMTIPLMDRAVYFGDGIYDVIYVHNGIMFSPEDHLDRLLTNCGLMRMDFDMPKQELRALLQSLIDQLDRDILHVNLYVQISRGTAPRSHAFPKPPCKANLLVFAHGFTPRADKPFYAITAPDKRFQFCNIKTINLIPNILANQASKEAGAEECIFIRDGFITEGSHSNVSILKDGVLITPPLSEWILPSITRKHLLQVCEKAGIPVVERPFTLQEMMDADEIMVGASLFLLQRVLKIDSQQAGGKDDARWKRINGDYLKRFEEETAPR